MTLLKTRNNVCGGGCVKEKCGDGEPSLWSVVPGAPPVCIPEHPPPHQGHLQLTFSRPVWYSGDDTGSPFQNHLQKQTLPIFLKWLMFPWNSEIRSAVWNLSKWILTASWKPGRGEPGPLKCKWKSSEPEKGTKWEMRCREFWSQMRNGHLLHIWFGMSCFSLRTSVFLIWNTINNMISESWD